MVPGVWLAPSEPRGLGTEEGRSPEGSQVDLGNRGKQ